MFHVRKSVVLVLAVGSTLGAVLGVTAHHVLPASPIATGVFIGEQRPPEDVAVVEWLMRRRDLLKKRTVHLRYENDVTDTTLGELGVSIDIAATMERAEQIGRTGSWIRRVRDAAKAKRGEIEVPLAF